MAVLLSTDVTATLMSEIPISGVSNEIAQQPGRILVQATIKIALANAATRTYPTGGLPLIDTSTPANGAVFALGYDPLRVLGAWPNGPLFKSDFTQAIPMHVDFNSAASKLHVVLFQDYPALAGGMNQIADAVDLSGTTYLNGATAVGYITLLVFKRSTS